MYTIKSVYKQSNLKIAFRRLITNPESTYKNYFRDLYRCYAMALDDNIKVIQKNIKAGYMPEPAIRVYMPKSNGLNRMYSLISINDQIVYQAFANVIAEAISSTRIKKRYKKSVFGNLYAGKDSEFFYQQWEESYKAYTKSIIKTYGRGNEFIASFDLTACYDSISHGLLKKLLIKNGISENCVDQFLRILDKWELFDNAPLGTGIPQGPISSGIIAEVVLSQYDELIERLQNKYSFKYFRYVDDIRILSNNEDTLKWIVFLLDKKSKELGLFPQSAKINIHKITNIEEEIKRISKPLFDDEFDDKGKSLVALKNINELLRSQPVDLTTIKRYLREVQHNSKTNKILLKALSQYPNLIHSFAYYVLRYPRILPKSITDFIYSYCNDKTKQFSAGLLLESINNKIGSTDRERFVALAKELIRNDRKEQYIFDCRFYAQLALLVFCDKDYSKQIVKKVQSIDSWWIKQELISKFSSYGMKDYTTALSAHFLVGENVETALIAAESVIKYQLKELPSVSLIAPIAQNVLKRAGIIHRSRYSNSQINRYLMEIIGTASTFHWKKKLGPDHDKLEMDFFQAQCYWQTDITAFVNLWDTIDDRLCSLIVGAHSELGGYNLGNVGGIEGSRQFIAHLPSFYNMVIGIHKLRLKSHLSHSKVKQTNEYTGPIKYSERRNIKNLISNGINELIAFW